MPIVTWVIYALFGLVLLAGLVVVIGLPQAMWRNRRIGDRYRENLLTELKRTRLARMLGVLGVDPVKHLHQEPVVDVVRQMRNCAACTETTVCDQELSTSADVTVNTIVFCPNQKSLDAAVNRPS